MTSSGATVFPMDFDILRPAPSTTNPWVRTARYGGRPRVPTPSSREEWNHPRC